MVQNLNWPQFNASNPHYVEHIVRSAVIAAPALEQTRQIRQQGTSIIILPVVVVQRQVSRLHAFPRSL